MFGINSYLFQIVLFYISVDGTIGLLLKVVSSLHESFSVFIVPNLRHRQLITLKSKNNEAIWLAVSSPGEAI